METKQTNLFSTPKNKPQLTEEDKIYIKLLKSGVAFADHIYPSFICKDIYMNASTSNKNTLEYNQKLIKRAQHIKKGYYHITSDLKLHQYNSWILKKILDSDENKYKPSRLDKAIVRRILIKLQLK